MENDETMIPDKDVSVFKTPKGINEDIVREISAIKGEPEWMLEYRLKALDCFLKKPMPTWGVDLSRVDFDEYTYYIRPSDKQTNKLVQCFLDLKDSFSLEERRWLILSFIAFASLLFVSFIPLFDVLVFKYTYKLLFW